MNTKEEELCTWGEPEKWSQYKIVAVHALADQKEILEKIGVSPETCTYVGVYWLYSGEIIFVDVLSVPHGAGVYCNIKENSASSITFNVGTLRSPLTTSLLEAILDWLATWIDQMPSMKHFIEGLTVRSKQIFYGDILSQVES